MCKSKSIVLNLGSGSHACPFVSIILFLFNSDFPFRSVLLFDSPFACVDNSTVPLDAPVPAYFQYHSW